jgi:hypothetical protein
MTQTTAAQFGQNNAPDPNLVPGWTVQGGGQVPVLNPSTGIVSSELGVPSPGYAQAGLPVAAAELITTGNGMPGVAYPPSNNTSAGNTDQILTNPGYADVNPSLLVSLAESGTALASSIVPVPASGTAFTNPVGRACTVAIAGGTVTAVEVGSSQVGTGDGNYVVPAGAQVTLTYSAAPTWTWKLA